MQRVKSWEIGEGFGIANLRLVERELRDPGPGQVRIRPRAFSLNYRDYMVVTGAYNKRQPLPLVPLSDAVGIVDAIGSGVDRVKVGDRVAPTFAQRWIAGPADKNKLASTLGSPIDGVASQALVLDAEGVVKVPAYLSDHEAATLPCAAVTAWAALFEHASLAPGQTVLVQGTGGVSIFALLFARLAGARVIVTSSSDAKLERARSLGAWETINYRADPDWGRSARALAGGVGVDQVVEVGGAGTMDQSLSAVRPGGTISVIGVLDGASAPLALTRVLMNVVRMQGILVGPRETFERMNAALEAARLQPIVDRTFPFDALPAALESLRSGQHFGKIVIEAA